jgi:hypothetical protein
METEALGLAQELDFSLAALFWRATFTVKVVMIALVLASIWAWGVIIQKYVEFAGPNGRRQPSTGRSGRASRSTTWRIGSAMRRARAPSGCLPPAWTSIANPTAAMAG